MIRFEKKADVPPVGKKAAAAAPNKSPELALEKPAAPAKGATNRDAPKED
ncbi:MAG: hypothetical protein ACK4N1_02175 [Pseudorhizobium sp.]